MNLLIGYLRQEGAKITCQFQEEAMKHWLHEFNSDKFNCRLVASTPVPHFLPEACKLCFGIHK
tara:strand:- start:18 stop:206 length:189 start_codon:yes stop_codon:yes gene_type:complete